LVDFGSDVAAAAAAAAVNDVDVAVAVAAATLVHHAVVNIYSFAGDLPAAVPLFVHSV